MYTPEFAKHIAVNKQTATTNHQQATSNKQQATSNHQQATSNQQPSTSNQQPATSLMRLLFLIFNHQLTPLQEEDARTSLGVSRIINLPSGLRELWSQIPSHLHNISNYLDPLKNWLSSEASEGDCVLIQGDLGACFIMAEFAFDKGLIPVYATTRREAAEEIQADGSVKLTHQFKHQIFRRYGI